MEVKRNMRIKVSKNQFLIKDDKLVHEPTGAVFLKDGFDVRAADWGSTNEPLASGDKYEPTDIEEVARDILLVTRMTGLG